MAGDAQPLHIRVRPSRAAQMQRHLMIHLSMSIHPAAYLAGPHITQTDPLINFLQFAPANALCGGSRANSGVQRLNFRLERLKTHDLRP